MEELNAVVGTVGSFAWGPIMIVLLVGTGIWLTFGTRVVQFRKLIHAFKLLFSKDQSADGDITPFQALMTSLSATIGTGNIAGVATAIASGGPGAIFWMWVTGAVGGSMKFGEAVLAVRYRITNELGEQSGGPMYYIKSGMK
jgi:AGCS family alanine or glycine:cation symporter